MLAMDLCLKWGMQYHKWPCRIQSDRTPANSTEDGTRDGMQVVILQCIFQNYSLGFFAGIQVAM